MTSLPPRLMRPFRIIAFDWDGTAVSGRSEDTAALREPIERLLRAGVLVLVVTGTNMRNIDRQFSAAIRGLHKTRLYLATDRGSEVYGFDARGQPVQLWGSVATPEEDRLLTAAAEVARDRLVARTNLEVEVIYDRLNRRKIDLIPIEEWRDPPKAAIGPLLAAVEARLRGAGLTGLDDVLRLVEAAAREVGLAQARVTSDVKHVEIGLTDKRDAIAWLLRQLADPQQIAREDILVVGDEFGPVVGLPGSDSLMLAPGLSGATFVSVGTEPGGVPEPVIHLGGGPASFRALLMEQASLHPVELPAQPTTDPGWTLVEEGFNLAREHEVESLFTVANGYVGVRGSLGEGSPLSAPATFTAGVFEAGFQGAVPELAQTADWTQLRLTLAGHRLTMDASENPVHRRVLDLRQGILWREWEHRDPAGRITQIQTLRLASLADRHLLVEAVLIRPENYSETLVVEGALNRSQAFRTRGSEITVALAQHARWGESGADPVPPHPLAGSDPPVERWEVPVEVGRTYRLDRMAVLCTSRDVGAPEEAARSRLEQALDAGIEAAIDAHRAVWEARWQTADVQLDGDPVAQRALRFAAYHLVSAANPEDERVSIGARGLTGAAYKGHVFWDTEIYMLPFFTLTDPAAARSLLMYRFHTLPAARAKARAMGYRGALFAWESADTGEEVTPRSALTPDGEVIPILTGEQEHHISADVAYAVWKYSAATDDDRFLLEAGAEILLETARFWASRASLGGDDRYHIRGVIGPDEYHESVDDNAFTNGMARWNLERGVELTELLASRHPERWEALARRLDLHPAEVQAWSRTAEAMYDGFDPATGLFEQFRGYFQLEDIELPPLERRTVPADVLFGRGRVQGSRILKQADVVLLIALLWDRFSPEVREANFRYYEPRTAHGSSLSPAIHALVAARLGQVELAGRYFRQAAEVDLANNMGNAAGGVHLATLGGLWQAAAFGFAGLQLASDEPAVHPNLPPGWQRLAFGVEWRGRWVAMEAVR